MADLNELDQWDTVPQIETDTVWKGGTDGPANNQGKALANRTLYLKNLVEALGTGKLDLSALASQAQAEAGTDDTKWMSPLKTAQAIAVHVAALVDASPATLDTLNELAAALGDDPNFAATITAALAGKLAIPDFQKSAPTFATAGGTADAITAAYAPAITTDSAGRIPTVTLAFLAGAANTGSGTTLDVGTGAFGMVKGAGLPIVAGDIDGAGSVMIVRGVRGADAAHDKWVVLNPATGVTTAGTLDNAVQDFRLSLMTGVPVTSADVIAAGTIYLVPYKGDRIALYDGAGAWNDRISAEISIAVPAVANTMHDVFVYDNAGAPTLEVLAWTNDTTRATALVYQNGILVKSGAPTRRYVGSFSTTGVAGKTEDSFANRLLWNYNNRVTRQARGTFSADRATTSTAYVELNSEIRMGFVVGVSEDAIALSASGSVAGDQNRWAGTAFGFDGTTAEVGLEGGAIACGALGSTVIKGGCALAGYKTGISPGYHYATVLGKTDAGTCTWQSATSTTGAKFYAHLALKG